MGSTHLALPVTGLTVLTASNLADVPAATSTRHLQWSNRRQGNLVTSFNSFRAASDVPVTLRFIFYFIFYSFYNKLAVVICDQTHRVDRWYLHDVSAVVTRINTLHQSRSDSDVAVEKRGENVLLRERFADVDEWD